MPRHSTYKCIILQLALVILACDRADCFSRAPPKVFPTSLYSASTDTEVTSPPSSPSISNEENTCAQNTETITVPRFYEGEVPEGSYPSPLHSIHVESLLTAEQSMKCRQLAKEYAATSGCWDSPDNGRHQTYATCDFPLDECETLSTFLEEIDFHEDILSRLSQHYNVDMEDMSYLDLFCAHYQAQDYGGETGVAAARGATMDRLEEHRDGSLLSFTVLLTPPDEFEGGGTTFDALRDVNTTNNETSSVLYPKGVIRPSRAGDCVLHSGKLLHGADVVTSGERTVLVGFIEVADWCIRLDGLAEACTNFGRMDVAAYRYKRQQAKTANGDESGWMLNNRRWLPDSNTETGEGRSYVRGFCPRFPSVTARADLEYQRRKKLQAEDVLLRSILLPEKRQVLGFSYDEITVL